MSNIVSSGEQLPPPLEAGGPFDFPDEIRETSARMLGYAIRLTQSLQVAETPEADQEVEATPGLGETLLVKLEQEGTLTAHERDFIETRAEEISHLLMSSNDDVEGSANALGWLFVAYEGVQGRPRRERRRLIQSQQETIVETALGIAERGAPLLGGTETKIVEANIRKYVHGEPPETPDDAANLIVDEKNIAILRTLLAFDVVTHVQNVPSGAVGKSDISQAKKVSIWLKALQNRKPLHEIIDLLYDTSQLYNRAAHKVKNKYRTHTDRTQMLNVLYSGIKVLETGAAYVETDRLRISSVAELEQSIDVRREGDNYLIEGERLLQHANDYFREDPSELRMWGALIVEDWTASLDTIVLADQEEPHVELRPLRKAIEAEATRREQEELEEITQAYEVEINALETKYNVSGQQLRGLEGGLRLRRTLLDLKESGTQDKIFDHDSAHVLSGLSLDTERQTRLSDDVRELRALWTELADLKPRKPERGSLLRAIDTLTEYHESASPAQLNDETLQPIWRLAELVNQPEAEDTPVPEVSERAKPRQLSEAHFEPHFPRMEPVEAFPPDITADDIKDDLRKFLGHTRERHSIEWERIDSLVTLGQELQSSGYKVEALRLIHTDWHPLPHYVLEVRGPRGLVAIIESPIYAHATYVIASREWRAVVTSGNHKQVREYNEIGVRVTPKVHAAGKTAAHHRGKLRKEALVSL